MTDHITISDNYTSIKSKWQQTNLQEHQLNLIPSLFNTFLQDLWVESENMMDLFMADPAVSSTIMQDYIFKQMKGFLCTRQRFYELLETQDKPIEYTISPVVSLLTESTISDPYTSCSERSSDLDSTPLLTSHPSTSSISIQERIKENKEQSDTIRPKLSPSPSTPTLGKSYTSSCCDGHFLPACNYLSYYPNENNNNRTGEMCHFCDELITPPLKKSFSMDDFSNRPLDDDSSCYTSDESTINKQVQPLIHKVPVDVTPTEVFEYKQLSSFSKQSNDSLDSIIQQHQDIISQSLQNSKKERRRSMFGLFSHKKLSSFFSLKKKKKVASSYSFYQKKDMSVLI
jgi:hypothetical protein